MSVHLSIDGIRGESSDVGHKGWLDLDELEWGSRRRITSHTSTKDDRESANAEITELSFVRRMDSASPSLFLAACCGRGVSMVIHLSKTGAGSGADTFVEYRLSNALISSYHMLASGQANRRPVERVTVSFSALDLRYTPYDEDGAPLAPIAVGFDTSTNMRR